LDELVQTKVTLGTYIQAIVLGKGNINILTKREEQKFMLDVYYIFVLKHNFMSRRQLLQKGYIIYMEYNHCVIIDKCPSIQLIENIQMTSNKMFPLTSKLVKKKNTSLSIGKGKDTQSLHLQQKVCAVLMRKIVCAVSRNEKMEHR
jgi:hypothetical protein